MWKPLALVACCAAVSVPVALADESQSSRTCTPLKKIYSEKNWRDPKPADGRRACPVPRRAGARNTVGHWRDYRRYRQITPYRCLRGREGTFAIPCSIIDCESHFNWSAYNSSGAVGIYQLLGWGAPYPARTFRDRLRNHEIAASLSLSNWVCA